MVPTQTSGLDTDTQITTGVLPEDVTSDVTIERTTDADLALDSALQALAALPEGDPDRVRLREEIICQCLPLARRLALRFHRRGEDLDDLMQVAVVGLIKSVDRFDVTRGIEFAHYAVPTMLGELKRHFRDRGWSMRVHRHLQELHLEVTRAIPALSQTLQRQPTVADLAEHLGITENEVLAGLECSSAYLPRSLNSLVRGGDDTTELGDLVGGNDNAMELVPDRQALRQAMSCLPEREQQILVLRFFANLTQSEIAACVGVSQMHVSRLLTRSLAQLRDLLLADD